MSKDLRTPTSPFLGENFWTDIIICTFLGQGHTEIIGQSEADTEDTCRESVADGEDETTSRTPGRWSIGKAPLPNLLMGSPGNDPSIAPFRNEPSRFGDPSPQTRSYRNSSVKLVRIRREWMGIGEWD